MKKWDLMAVGVLVIAGTILTAIKLSSSKTTWLRFEDFGVSLEYPDSLKSEPITEEDKKTNTIFKASEKDSKEPDVSIALSYEDELKLLSNLLRQDILDILLNNSTKVLPAQYPNYKELSRKIINSTSPKQAEIKFSYQQEGGEVIIQRFYILVTSNENRAHYLTAQAKQTDYDKLEKSIFDRMFSSLRLSQ